MTGTVPANASQSLNFSGEAYVSKVTGKLVNAKQDAKGQWIVDSSNTATPEITWTPESSSFSEVVSPVEAGYYLKTFQVMKQATTLRPLVALPTLVIMWK
nr:hypothetical protein [Lactobacillus johnsonii]